MALVVTQPAPSRRIAVVTAEESVLPNIQEWLSPGFETSFFKQAALILPASQGRQFEVVLLDLDTAAGSTAEGLEALRRLRQNNDIAVLVAVTRSTARGLALKASQAGADEFFIAPVDFRELQMVLTRALEKRRMELEGRHFLEQLASKSGFAGLIGSSLPMRRVYDAITRVAESSATVLIRGESGTGKELVARAIVGLGPRRQKAFIRLNCAAFPENLIESELFGHERGAFTGADVARPGHIELADGGTLFLDEIATLGHGLQSKLLRALEERAVQRIGGKTLKKIDFRLITASNDNLEELVQQGRFREDLYYRINVVPISLPPLRERRGDLPLLVDHFLRFYCGANHLPLKCLHPDVLQILEDYHWPGNVRELENLAQRLVLMTDDAVITAEHLPQEILYSSVRLHEAMLIPQEGIDFDGEMARIEAAYLEAALRRTGGKKVAAAALLRVNQQRMKYLCRKYKL